MLQSLVTMLFMVAAAASVLLTTLVIRGDWNAIRAALGFGASIGRAPLPLMLRPVPARRAAIVRVELTGMRRAA